jgi:hypothetical protein
LECGGPPPLLAQVPAVFHFTHIGARPRNQLGILKLHPKKRNARGRSRAHLDTTTVIMEELLFGVPPLVCPGLFECMSRVNAGLQT